ncbi:MAG: hypothetical protein HKN44_08640 [Ilumatobacter sp.]|nr:hypothetical protein [Ilumatobacter sp.]
MPTATVLLRPTIVLVAFFGSFGLAQAPAQAQAGPTVTVEVDATEAAPGDTVTASVYIRNGTNIAGADIGVETNSCLRILSQTPGDYLPTASGGFVVLNQTTDNSSRFAVAIIDRSALANADGIFFEVEIEVLCDSGNAPIAVSFAELSAYADPTAEPAELIAYRQEDGTLGTTNADVPLVATGGPAAPDANATTSPSSVPPGGAFDVHVQGCSPGTAVTGSFQGRTKTATCAAAAGFALRQPATGQALLVGFVAPSTPGTYNGTATGANGLNVGFQIVVVAQVPTTVAPTVPPTTVGSDGAPDGALPATGSGGISTTTSVALGLLVIGLGSFVVAQVRRRRPTSA